MNIDLKQNITNAIIAFSNGTLSKNALTLFQALGYVTERQAPLHKKTKEEFKDTFVSTDKRFDETKARFIEWKYVDLLFQLSQQELQKQTSLFNSNRVDNTIIEAYLFFVIELSKEQYSRTELSLITREVNRLFPMPAMILFKHGDTLTLSVINRRLHKRDESKDVLEKVTQIKDINIASPHRAHIEILFDLSFDELNKNFHFTNFVELHNAWQKTLDTKLLNKKFFEELSNWYFWAQMYVEFPNDRKLDEGKNVQINLIRLITRMIFVWFLKEKNLVEEDLFDKNKLKKILKSFDPNGEKSKTYYTAILQNLFFATLNQKMTDRKFVDETNSYYKKDHGVKNLFRYPEQFSVSETEVKKLFKDIPFLNGGLFDCLDKENEESGKVEFIDGFTRIEKKRAIVPDLLFFGNELTLDLSEGYGYKRNKEKCRGLFEIFNDYKFTIEENTPIEEEIALDPELLGKVFENLLAYYNPETETTARKQTGSFYTPREIVNYMVDESLIAYLKTQMLEDKPAWLQLGNLQTEMFGNDVRKGQLKLEQPLNKSRWKEKKEELETNLRKVIAYSNDEHPFTDEEDIQQLIYAIDHCKILDPACGSGAFPMGILHKLVYVLGRLDENNVRWRELQKRKAQLEIEKALNDTDKKEREKKLIDINESFEDNASDYGRKLYLIENCIYGVDIQPIAVQISKLRFFISLVVDQKEKQGAANRGIRPLPNLETKFVAANTLIGLEKPVQLPMGYHLIEPLQDKLQQVRHKHFEAKSRRDKLKCQREDKAIRNKIAEQLKSLGFGNKDADKIARFDIYDQNASSDWLEPEWMFGRDLSKGFDIVIGNPPYIFTRDADFSDEFKEYIAKKYFSLLSAKDKKSKANQSGKINLFALFILRGLFESHVKGTLTYIVPNNLLRTTTYDLIRKYLLDNSKVDELVDLGSGVFDNVTASTILIRVSNSKNNSNHQTKIVTGIKDLEKHEFTVSTIEQNQFSKNVSYTFNLFAEGSINDLLNKISEVKNYLGEFCIDIIEGIVAHKHLISESKIKNSYPLIEGKTIKRYGLNPVKKFIEWDTEQIHRTRPDYLWKADKKILIQRISGGTNPLTAALDQKKYRTFASVNNLLLKPKFENQYEFVLGLINSKLINWFYANSFSNNSELTVNISKTFMEKLPVIEFSADKNESIRKVVQYVIALKANELDANFFERLIDAMVYELYLPEAIQNANCEVLKHLSNLPELPARPPGGRDGEDEETTKKNLKTIEKVYAKLSDPKHPVSVALHKMQEVEEIKIIEGRHV
jgi:type I restriction-modification system DNA methylase subunit